MRGTIVTLLGLACLLPVTSHGAPYLRYASQAGNVAAGGSTTVKVQCPAGSIPVGVSLKSKHAGKVEELSTSVLDKNGNVVDLSALADVTPLIGGGQGMTVVNTNLSVAEDFVVVVLCFSPTAFSDGVVTLAKSEVQVAPQASANTYVFCPPGTQALGGVSDGGQASFIDLGTSPIFGTSANPIFLGNVADGTTGAPTGWEATAYNTGTTAKPLKLCALCGRAPSAQTQVSSATVDTAASNWVKLTGAIQDDREPAAIGYDAYYVYLYKWYYWYYWDYWGDAGDVASAEYYAAYYAYYSTYYSNQRIRGFSGKAVARPGKSLPAAKATARAVFGIVTLPNSAAPPAITTVTVVEFYNAALDHYFITAIAKEIGDLDSGIHPGWARTGQSFKAYGIGSGGHAGRQPVCRAYGNPARGLDSHFYSASMEECYSTLSSFNDAWLLEASEVFEVDLPDPTTGACPAGGVPIYRVWNNRADSNHRYTTSIATRDQMVAKGYVAEGYGPNSVTLCALP